MLGNARKTIAAIAALGALALGGSTLANAASSGSTAASNSTATTAQTANGMPPAAPRGGPPPGQHVGANGEKEVLLTGDTAAKVKAAAEAKVSGGTVERVETDADSSSPYEAHVRKSDGSEVVVLVNKSFEVTAVNSMTR